RASLRRGESTSSQTMEGGEIAPEASEWSHAVASSNRTWHKLTCAAQLAQILFLFCLALTLQWIMFLQMADCAGSRHWLSSVSSVLRLVIPSPHSTRAASVLQERPVPLLLSPSVGALCAYMLLAQLSTTVVLLLRQVSPHRPAVGFERFFGPTPLTWLDAAVEILALSRWLAVSPPVYIYWYAATALDVPSLRCEDGRGGEGCEARQHLNPLLLPATLLASSLLLSALSSSLLLGERGRGRARRGRDLLALLRELQCLVSASQEVRLIVRILLKLRKPEAFSSSSVAHIVRAPFAMLSAVAILDQ
ncbi:MAG: hypothetical protein SGPRY_015089, partial [Prymnesium sp.]